MATSTTRLGLTKPDGTDLVDIAVLNTNANKIDAAAGAFVCTSTTRPSTPYAGQIIYETDTDQSFVWDSATSTWNTLAPGATVCTSSSRPASPVPGQIIYETDTKLTYVYASGAWTLVVSEQSVITFSNRTNFLINGAFDFWQRGTSSTTNDSYIVDRWRQFWNAGTATVPRSTYCTVITLQYSVSFASTSGTSPALFQRIEAANAIPLVGQTVTFSIWAKSTVGTGGLSWTSFFPTTTADTFSAITTDQSGVFAATMTVGTWTRYSATFTVAAGAVRGYGVNVFRSVTTTSTTTLYAGAQLEIGAVASPFRRNAPSIQAELAVCQRYYEKSYGVNVTPGTANSPAPLLMRLEERQVSGGNQYIYFADAKYKTEKRGVPNVTFFSQAGTTSKATVNRAGNSGAAGFYNLYVAASADSSGNVAVNESGANGFICYVNVGTSATSLSFGVFNYTADAEL